MICDAAVMTGGQASFIGMLLDFLCRCMVSILTNNIALTFYMSPMRRDILMRKNLQFHFSSEGNISILFNPKPVGFQQITIWYKLTLYS
jgi:hypothetical protein